MGFCLLNLIAFEIYDHSFRIYGIVPLKNDICRNILEMACYIFYSLDVLLNLIAKGMILDKGTYLRHAWNVFFLILLILR